MTPLEKLQLAITDGAHEVQEHLDIDDDWQTILFLAEDDEKCTVLPLQHLMNTETGKDLVGEVIIPMMIEKTGAKAMGIITTAWTVRANTEGLPEGETPIDMLIRPSLHPNREEILLIMLADQETQRIMTADIARPEGADHPELSEWRVEDADEFGGRLWDAPIKALRGENHG